MTSSRIFVRGLPPNLSEDQFRKHFSGLSAVTDIKHIPQRRIGYVGYKTPDDAAKAVKYFNKSYIRMSRIFVEIARPLTKSVKVGGGSLTRSEPDVHIQNGGSGSKSDGTGEVAGSHKNRKRKRELEELPDSEPKLQEFLEVMQGPSRSRTWADEHTLNRNGSGNLEATQQASERHSSKHGQVTSTSVQQSNMSKKVKDDNVPPVVKNDDDPIKEAQGEIDTGDEDHQMADKDTDVQQAEPNSAISDKEWLRSRTSRLLGLVDDDEVQRRSVSPEEQKNPAPRPTRVKASPDPTTGEREDEQTKEKTPPDPALSSSDNPGTDPRSGNCRLFIRNLPYSARETDLREQFASYGELTEVHVPTTSNGTTKGFGYIAYADPESASRAFQELDGASFQGRIMHVLPANTKVEKKLDEYAISKLPLKKQNQIRRKANAASSVFNWNSLYMSTDAVMSSIADRLNISKADLLDPTSSEAAVKQAHAETHVIQETKDYFAANGVDLEAFHKHDRGDMAILVKNFSYGTKASEIKSIFEEYGHVSRVLVPPAGTIAIVEFTEACHARAAFTGLAYRRFKDSVLFLEKAPKGVFKSDAGNTTVDGGDYGAVEPKPSTSELLETATKEELVDSTTLFIRNLNFSTTSARLTEICKAFDGFMSARVKTKPDPKRPGQTLSMGFGFLEFRTKPQAQSAASALDGYNLDGHKLLVRAANRPLDAGEEKRKEDMAKKAAGRNTKIIIKNLPFEASKKEVRSLFGSYGQLRSVRVPKKFDSSARGFAFAEFVTAREAENAMNALKHTHLLGRRLVLEFAAESAVDAEEELQKMQEKVGKQTNKVSMQRLMGTSRQKFTVGEDNAAV
ncbi:MAG: Multiple RNA-binding domain-containing protein 1 [Peltula sp. TS41687]|nr:MAG: Multiple RNA-binding domain-containing protein 1 [Peltula sp. TS41687]